MSRRISTFIVLSVLFALLWPAAPAKAAPAPDITAKNALVLNIDNGFVLYEKQAGQLIAPGPMVRLMTAMLAMENLPDLDEPVTAGANIYNGLKTYSAANIKRGDVMTVRDYLCCLLIAGSGEAANVLASRVSGSPEAFVDLMNRRAAELGAKDTVFANVHGEYDADAHTTLSDMAVLIKHALSLEHFLSLSDKTYHKTRAIGDTPSRELYSTNYILIGSMSKYYYRHASGLANAHDESGYSLATLDDHGSARLLCLVAGCRRYTKDGVSYIGSFTDAKSLLVWADNNFKSTRLIRESEPVAQIPVLLSSKHSSVALNAVESLYAVIEVDYDEQGIRKEFDLPDKLLAPVKKGQVVGSVTLWYGENNLGKVPLCAASDVQVNMLNYYTYHINQFFSNIWVRIVSASVIGLFVFFVIATIRINRNKRRSQSRRARLRL